MTIRRGGRPCGRLFKIYSGEVLRDGPVGDNLPEEERLVDHMFIYQSRPAMTRLPVTCYIDIYKKVTPAEPDI